MLHSHVLISCVTVTGHYTFECAAGSPTYLDIFCLQIQKYEVDLRVFEAARLQRLNDGRRISRTAANIRHCLPEWKLPTRTKLNGQEADHSSSTIRAS